MEMNDEHLERLKTKLISEIESEMKKGGVSQAEVARRIGAKRTNINMVIRRSSPVTLDFLVKMATSLGLTVNLKISK